jgi:N-acetylglucosaminyl-diphospho-decaprenol L-rhamnosyltransferase
MDTDTTPSSSIDVAVVTVTYNCADFIESFLEALAVPLQKAQPRMGLFLVDNASSDATLKVARRFIAANGLEDRVIVLPQTDNLGFGTGCNKGAEAARLFQPDYYWFLNPDTRVSSDTGDNLLDFFKANPEADFVGSQLVNEEGTPRPSAFRFPSAVSEFCRSVRLGVMDRLLPRGQIALPVSDTPHRADWLTGASFMVKREVFDQLEGFDERFFLYFEEVDLFYRARQQGFNCWFTPESKVYHFAGASTGIASNRKATKPRPQYWFDSRRYFYCKNFGRVYFLLCDLAAITGLSLWKLRLMLQDKDCGDPPGLLKDIAANSLFAFRAGR